MFIQFSKAKLESFFEKSKYFFRVRFRGGNRLIYSYLLLEFFFKKMKRGH